MSESDMSKIIGKLLAEMRSAKGMTLLQVANLMGKSDATINRYEKATRNVKIGDLKKLCEIYGWEFDDFVKESQIRFEQGIVSKGNNAVPYYVSTKNRSDMAYHLEGQEDLTPEEKAQVEEYIQFILSKRK